MLKKSKKCVKLGDFFIGCVALGLGIAVLTSSTFLLLQSLCKHKGEGPGFETIYRYPFRQSNWMKSSISLIVVSSFGVALGGIQILASLILIFMPKKYRILGLIIWMGCHMVIFIFNVICFSIAVSVKANEHKNHLEYWTNYAVRNYLVHNFEGHLFCALLVSNSIFIIFVLAFTTSALNSYANANLPIELPESVY